MKFKIGKFEVTVQEFSFAEKIKFSLDVSYVSKELNGSVYISYWQDSDNPLVVKGEIKTGDIDHA